MLNWESIHFDYNITKIIGIFNCLYFLKILKLIHNLSFFALSFSFWLIYTIENYIENRFDTNILTKSTHNLISRLFNKKDFEQYFLLFGISFYKKIRKKLINDL